MCEVVDSDFNADLSWGGARDCVIDLGRSNTHDCITDLCEGYDRITGFAADKVGGTCDVVNSSDASGVNANSDVGGVNADSDAGGVDADSDVSSTDVDFSDAGGVNANSNVGSGDVSWFIELIL